MGETSELALLGRLSLAPMVRSGFHTACWVSAGEGLGVKSETLRGSSPLPAPLSQSIPPAPCPHLQQVDANCVILELTPWPREPPGHPSSTRALEET